MGRGEEEEGRDHAPHGDGLGGLKPGRGRGQDNLQEGIIKLASEQPAKFTAGFYIIVFKLKFWVIGTFYIMKYKFYIGMLHAIS